MADQINLIADLKSLFFNTTAIILGLDPAAPATQSIIRQTWPKQGAPGYTIDSDWLFLKITPVVNHQYSKQKDITMTSLTSSTLNQATSYVRVWSIDWEIWGPNSCINAINIRDQLLYDSIHDLIAVNNLYLMSDISDPVRAPEPFMGQWWERWDLHTEFYEQVIRNITIPCVATIPITTTNDQTTTNNSDTINIIYG